MNFAGCGMEADHKEMSVVILDNDLGIPAACPPESPGWRKLTLCHLRVSEYLALGRPGVCDPGNEIKPECSFCGD